MIRAAVWTFGLFVVGAMVCHLFPTPLVEPLVLFALGAALLLLSGRVHASSPASGSARPNPPPTESRAERAL